MLQTQSTTLFPSLLRGYLDLWKSYEEEGFSKALNPSDNENSLNDPWKISHYFSVGENALQIIVSSLIAAGRQPPQRVLDFPSGSGRVTRHLRAMFRSSEIGACDLYEHHVSFCAAEFGTIPIISSDSLDELNIGKWDVIFCGSLLTHLPAHLFRSAIGFISRSLADDGVAIVTLEGRHAIHIQDHKWKFIEQNLFDLAREDYKCNGFGFVGYPEEFMGTMQRNSSYGVTLVSPSWATAEIAKSDDLRILGYHERAWDDHQDVLIFGRPGVNA